MDRAVAIDVFVELGRRLAGFGNDEISSSVIDKAVISNEWFTSSDILMAIEAIREEMLDYEKLLEWSSSYSRPQRSCRVGIIMAGNIPLVGFFDLLCVLISGHKAIVKPSSKDLILMQYIIELLRNIYCEIPVEIYANDTSVDMVIATGGDVAATHFASQYADIPALIRGSRHSVAILSGRENIKQMDGLRQDIYSYNGLGCRNVSLVFIPKGWQGELPKPESMIEMKYGNYLCSRAMLVMSCADFKDLNGVLAIESCSFPDDLSRVHYTYYDSLDKVQAWLQEHDHELQCVVTDSIDHPRRVNFGRAQYPTLWDYADGIDIMKFLNT